MAASSTRSCWESRKCRSRDSVKFGEPNEPRRFGTTAVTAGKPGVGTSCGHGVPIGEAPQISFPLDGTNGTGIGDRGSVCGSTARGFGGGAVCFSTDFGFVASLSGTSCFGITERGCGNGSESGGSGIVGAIGGVTCCATVLTIGPEVATHLGSSPGDGDHGERSGLPPISQ